jgi:hypothetical protein
VDGAKMKGDYVRVLDEHFLSCIGNLVVIGPSVQGSSLIKLMRIVIGKAELPSRCCPFHRSNS